ncbi:MAG: hypothetical protein IPK85_09010 [Gemmatimonadetes bacterium]|nr:hypothetical protein [Gemmatimonadota bacterium]
MSRDIYVPFDRATLLKDAELAYGPPASVGHNSESSSNTVFDEYIGAVGRVRIYDELVQTEEGIDGSKWLEVYPGALYVEDLVNAEYLAKVKRHEGDWKVSIRPKDLSWYLTLTLTGRVVTKIIDLPPQR